MTSFNLENWWSNEWESLIGVVFVSCDLFRQLTQSFEHILNPKRCNIFDRVGKQEILGRVHEKFVRGEERSRVAIEDRIDQLTAVM